MGKRFEDEPHPEPSTCRGQTVRRSQATGKESQAGRRRRQGRPEIQVETLQKEEIINRVKAADN